jgi:hypothetical protein
MLPETNLPAAETVGHPRYSGGGAVADLVMGRRRLLKVITGALASVGLWTLGALRLPKAASAYSEHGAGLNASACGSYDPDTWYDSPVTQNGWADRVACTDGTCVGANHPSEMGSWYAVQCAEHNASTNPFQWHYVGPRTAGGGTFLGDHNPDVCSGLDAWRWRIDQSCGYCPTSTWRCHDGWKVDSSGGYHSLTIAQGLVYCGNTLWSHSAVC